MKPDTAPLTAEGWNQARPAESFRTFASRIHTKAREILLTDGNHAEMFFFMPLNGVGHVVLWRNNDRDLEAGWLRKHIAEHYV